MDQEGEREQEQPKLGEHYEAVPLLEKSSARVCTEKLPCMLQARAGIRPHGGPTAPDRHLPRTKGLGESATCSWRPERPNTTKTDKRRDRSQLHAADFVHPLSLLSLSRGPGAPGRS